MVQTALAAGDSELAQRLVDGLEPRYPVREHPLCAACVQLAEHAGDLAEAAILYAQAADRWLEFGNVPERAHALLDRGRCLLALGRRGAEEPLVRAKELFSAIGYRPALAETEALLQQTATPASWRGSLPGGRDADRGFTLPDCGCRPHDPDRPAPKRSSPRLTALVVA